MSHGGISNYLFRIKFWTSTVMPNLSFVSSNLVLNWWYSDLPIRVLHICKKWSGLMIVVHIFTRIWHHIKILSRQKIIHVLKNNSRFINISPPPTVEIDVIHWHLAFVARNFDAYWLALLWFFNLDSSWLEKSETISILVLSGTLFRK